MSAKRKLELEQTDSTIEPASEDMTSSSSSEGNASKKKKTNDVIVETEASVENEIIPADCKLDDDIVKRFQCEPSGRLLIAGNVEWDATNKKGAKRNELVVFHRFTDEKYRGIFSGPQSVHSILIDENYKALSFGRNDKGQCGHKSLQTIYKPMLIGGLKDVNVIQAACGTHHTLFLTDTGAVYGCGDNSDGQLGIGSLNSSVVTKPQRINYRGAPICKIGCGGKFSVILDINGNLHTFGYPEYGQLGHNDDGQFFITNSRIAFASKSTPTRVTSFIEKDLKGHSSHVTDVKIVDFACGKNHTVAIDSQKRAFSFGFGGYGRLGHNEQKDEWIPRLIKYMNERVTGGAVRVFCGSANSLVISGHGNPYLFGKIKPGNSNLSSMMYPKVINDLCGFTLKSVGCSVFSSVFASDDKKLIAWGYSPTYGELGIGTYPKSSSQPTFVKGFDGVDVMKVAMGMEHSMLLVNVDDETISNEKYLAQPEYVLPIVTTKGMKK